MEPLDHMFFEGALKFLREGKLVSRSGWNGKGQYLGLQNPDEQSVNTLPYIYIVTVDGKIVPWVASQTDMLANDWEVVKNSEEEKSEINSQSDDSPVDSEAKEASSSDESTSEASDESEESEDSDESEDDSEEEDSEDEE